MEPPGLIIDDLKKVLVPPAQPTESGKDKNWAAVTNYFGRALPGDYVSFVEDYGSGEVGGWLTVLNPFSENRNLSLMAQFPQILSDVGTLKGMHPETCPYPILFEPGGLLPWGTSIDGDIYCWLTDGVSGKWDVVVLGRHSEPQRFNLTMCHFIAQSISGDIQPYSMPGDWHGKRVDFVPYKALTKRSYRQLFRRLNLWR